LEDFENDPRAIIAAWNSAKYTLFHHTTASALSFSSKLLYS